MFLNIDQLTICRLLEFPPVLNIRIWLPCFPAHPVTTVVRNTSSVLLPKEPRREQHVANPNRTSAKSEHHNQRTPPTSRDCVATPSCTSTPPQTLFGAKHELTPSATIMGPETHQTIPRPRPLQRPQRQLPIYRSRHPHSRLLAFRPRTTPRRLRPRSGRDATRLSVPWVEGCVVFRL